MLIFNDKIFRNLEEQVAYLTKQFNSLVDGVSTALGFIPHVLGVYTSIDQIPAQAYNTGDTMLIGTGTPYNVYVYTDKDTWQDIGKFPVAGPEGPQGKAGSQIYFGANNPTLATEGNEGDYYINSITGSWYVKTETEWAFAFSLKGERGPQGVQGVQGERGPQGVQGERGPRGIGIDSIIEQSVEPTSQVIYNSESGISYDTDETVKYEDGDATVEHTFKSTHNIPLISEGDQISMDVNEAGSLVVISSGEYVNIDIIAGATQGTLTAEQYAQLTNKKSNVLVIDNELYTLTDDGHEEGYLTYSHVGVTSTKQIVKTFTITIAALGWVILATPVTGYEYVNITIPASAKSGTLTTEQFETLISYDSNILVINGTELYRLNDKGHTNGVYTYTHDGFNEQGINKYFNLTLSTKAFTITESNISEGGVKTIKAGTGYKAEVFNGIEPTQAYGDYSHAEGIGCWAGNISHAEGEDCVAENISHAEGSNCSAEGYFSHAQGRFTQVTAHAVVKGASAQGMFNDPAAYNDPDPAIQTTGIGLSNTDRKNGLVVRMSGAVECGNGNPSSFKDTTLTPYGWVQPQLKKLNDWYDDVHYIKPTIAAFSTTNFASSYKLTGTPIKIKLTSFTHRETEDSNINGTLSLYKNNVLLQSGIAVSNTATTVTVTGDTESTLSTSAIRYELRGQDTKGNTISKIISVFGWYTSYIGGSTSATISSSVIAGLTDTNTSSLSGTRAVSLSTDAYIWLCSPTSVNSVTLQGFGVPLSDVVTQAYNGTTYYCRRTVEKVNAGSYQLVIN